MQSLSVVASRHHPGDDLRVLRSDPGHRPHLHERAADFLTRFKAAQFPGRAPIGYVIGISGVACTFVRLENPPSALQCQISARIGGDQLTLQGLAFDQPRNVFAITGGTGRWRIAGGQVVVRDVSDTESDITLFITDLG